MPVIAPFAALRYSAALAPQMSKLVAPPYDTICPAEQEALRAVHPNNVVRLILGKEGPAEARYQSAARELAEWRERGVLAEDRTAGLYVYTQRFTLPTGEEHTRQGFMALVRLGEGLVSHEQTVDAVREDRLELLRATSTNLSPLFALYRDPERALDPLLLRERGDAPLQQFRTPDGLQHALWSVTEPETIRRVQDRLAGQLLVVADGQHRLEAALLYRDEQRAKHPDAGPDAAFEYALAFLCNSAEPGLHLLPVHRALAQGTALDVAKLRLGLEKHFFVTERLMPPPTAAGARLLGRELKEAATRGPCFAVGVPKMPTMLICILRPGLEPASLPGMPSSPVLRQLDVTALQSLCLGHLLGLGPDATATGQLLHEPDTAAALARSRDGRAPAVFFLPAPRVEQVFAVAEANERMPPSSTNFFPKVPSGLALRSIAPAAKVRPA